MNDREIKYVLTGDSGRLKAEIASVERAAEQAGKSIDRALTRAFKDATANMTAEISKNLKTINDGLNNVQKGTQNAFNAQSLASYAKGQAAVATNLRQLEQQYNNLDRTAKAYNRTLVKTGVDSETASSITNNWIEKQRAALQDAGRTAGRQIGTQFGGIDRLASNLAIGIKQVDRDAAKANDIIAEQASTVSRLGERMRGAFGKAVRQDISEASLGVLKFGKSISSATSDVARFGFGIAAALAAFATIPLLKTITLVESAQLGLESLLATAEEAGLAIYRIYEFANQTSYDTASLIAYEQKLVSVGLSGEQAFGVIARVSDIGGAFGATADQLDRFYYVLSQIFGAGRATGQDFLQIQNAVPGFLQAISQAMNISAGEVKEAFGEGKVTSQVIADALNILTEEGGKAFQGAAKQSTTLAGMMNNLMDNIKRVGMAFFGVRIEMSGMEPALDGIYARIKKIVASILEVAENPLMVRGFEILGDAAGAALTVLEKYPQVLAVLAGLFIAFATDIISRIPFIGNLIGEIGYGTGLLIGLFFAMVTASRQMQQSLVVVFGQIVGFLQQNSGLFVSLLSNFKLLLDTLAQGVGPALIMLTQIFLNFLTVVLHVTNFLLALGNTIANFLGPEVTRMVTITLAFMAVSLALLPMITKTIAAFVALKAAVTSTAFAYALLATGIILLLGLLGGLFSKAPKKSGIGSLSGIFDDITDSTSQTIPNLDATSSAITETGKAAKEAAKQLAGFDKMTTLYTPRDSSDAGGGIAPGAIKGLTPPEITTPDFSALTKKYKDFFKDIDTSIPEFSWWDLAVPAAVLGGLALLTKLGVGKWLLGLFTAFKKAPAAGAIAKTAGAVAGLSAVAPGKGLGAMFASFGKGLLAFMKYVALGAGTAILVAVALMALAKGFNDVADANIDLLMLGLLLTATTIASAIFAVIGIPVVASLVALGGAVAVLIGVGLMSLSKGLSDATDAGRSINLDSLLRFTEALAIVSTVFALLAPLALFAAVSSVAVMVIGVGLLGSATALSLSVPFVEKVADSLPAFTDFVKVMAVVSAALAAIGLLSVFGAISTIATTVIAGGLTLSAVLLAAAIPEMQKVVNGSGVIEEFTNVLGDISKILTLIIGFTLVGSVGIVANDVIAGGLLVAAALLAKAIPMMDYVNANRKVLLEFILTLGVVSKILSEIWKYSVYGAIAGVASAVLGTGLMTAAKGLGAASRTGATVNMSGLLHMYDCLKQSSKILGEVDKYKLLSATINSLVSTVLTSALYEIATALVRTGQAGAGIRVDTYSLIQRALNIIRNMDLGSFFGNLGQALTGGAVKSSLDNLHAIAQKLRDIPRVGQDVIAKLHGIQDAMRTKWQSIGKSVADGFAAGLSQNEWIIASAVKRMWNNTVRAQLNGRTISASINGANATMGRINVPYLARGGVVGDPTLAMIGEQGREAVVPLENNTGWIDEIASKLNDARGGGDQPTVVNVYLDGQKVGGAISNSINNRSRVTGVNQIYV